MKIKLNWFDRTEFNCGAIQFPENTEELFSVMKSRHFNIFETIFQANIRKVAENIPQVAFEFWTEKKIKKQKEIGKFLFQ